MKKCLIMLLLCVAVATTFIACNRNGENESPVESNEPTSSTVKSGKEKNDSVADNTNGQAQNLDAISTKALADSIKNLNKRIEELSSHIGEVTKSSASKEELKKKADESALRGVLLFCGALSVLSILLAIFAVIGNRKIGRNLGEEVSELRRIQRAKSEKGLGMTSSMPDRNGINSNKKVEDLNARLSWVENKLRALERGTGTVAAQSREQKPEVDIRKNYQQKPKPVPSVTKGYFGNPSRGDQGGYFKKEMDYKDSDARFVAEISGSAATFAPILDTDAARRTALSSEYMKLAIEFTGCALTDMTDVRVKRKGEAVRRGERWHIIKKTLVELL